MIAYYETESTRPPGALLVELARALAVSTDELLGMKPVRETLAPKPPASSSASAASKSSGRRSARRPQTHRRHARHPPPLDDAARKRKAS